MITAIDTNVLLDVFGADPVFGARSLSALRRCAAEGRLVVCDLVWVETAAWFETSAACAEQFERLGITAEALNPSSASLAADLWRSYRTAGGRKDRVIADFIVGAHAATQADRLLSRDRGFYRERFSGVTLLDPAAPES